MFPKTEGPVTECLLYYSFPVNFEHGEVDPTAFETFRAGMSFSFPEERLGQNVTSIEPKLKVFVKSDQLTYSNVTRSASGKGSS